MIFTANNDEQKMEAIAQELTPLSHDRARAIGSVQPTPELRKQGYLNTLAVYGVHYHLLYECDIWSEPEASDSTNPIYQTLDGAAGVTLAIDLLIPEVGKVDCCALLPGQTKIAIPAETLSDRAAYVVVQFHQDTLEEVELLGFFAPFDPTDPYPEVDVGDVEARAEAGWQPMSELTRYLDEYQRLQDFKENDPLMQTLRKVESTDNSDALLAKLFYSARHSGSQNRMKEKFLVTLGTQCSNAGTKNLESAVRKFEVKGVSEAIAQPDLTDLAARLAEKFTEILGLK